MLRGDDNISGSDVMVGQDLEVSLILTIYEIESIISFGRLPGELTARSVTFHFS